ncbi:MAG: hypothetical protein RBU21_02950 [FCB group bacterium]|jgi:hypothetical protein|nr:hypothetical protein [FCB group bacterium]
MAIEIYMRDVNSVEGFLLHTAKDIAEVRATVHHVRENSIHIHGGDSTREVDTQYVIDGDSAYFEIVVG